MDTLVVWWGEDINYYLIPDPEVEHPEVMGIIERAAGKLLNSSDAIGEEDAEKLSLIFADPRGFQDEWLSSPEMKPYVGLFFKYRVTDSWGDFTTLHPTRVITTGYVP